MKLSFVIVKDEYINFLRPFSENVRENKGEKRPYLGILFEIEDMDYLAPLGSPKPKHKKLRDSITLMKIKDGEYGIININNMIPVNKADIINYNPQDEKLKLLVKSQLRWINKLENKERIIRNAKELHSLYIYKKLPRGLANLCNNFKLLETKCREWGNK